MGRWKVQAQPSWSVGLLDGAWLATSLSPPSRTPSVPDSLRSSAQAQRGQVGRSSPRGRSRAWPAHAPSPSGPPHSPAGRYRGARPPPTERSSPPLPAPWGGVGPTGGKGHILVTGCLPPRLLPCPPGPQLSPRLVWGQAQALLTRPKDPLAPLSWCGPLGPARAPVSPGPEHSHVEVLPGRVDLKEAAHTA